jgi:hypothetical protein
MPNLAYKNAIWARRCFTIPTPLKTCSSSFVQPGLPRQECISIFCHALLALWDSPHIQTYWSQTQWNVYLKVNILQFINPRCKYRLLCCGRLRRQKGRWGGVADPCTTSSRLVVYWTAYFQHAADDSTVTLLFMRAILFDMLHKIRLTFWMPRNS